MASQMSKSSASSLSNPKLSRLSKSNLSGYARYKDVQKLDPDLYPYIKPWILVANDDRFLLEMIEGTLDDTFQVEFAENGL